MTQDKGYKKFSIKSSRVTLHYITLRVYYKISTRHHFVNRQFSMLNAQGSTIYTIYDNRNKTQDMYNTYTLNIYHMYLLMICECLVLSVKSQNTVWPGVSISLYYITTHYSTLLCVLFLCADSCVKRDYSQRKKDKTP